MNYILIALVSFAAGVVFAIAGSVGIVLWSALEERDKHEHETD